jgi:hypothetical protein
MFVNKSTYNRTAYWKKYDGVNAWSNQETPFSFKISSKKRQGYFDPISGLRMKDNSIVITTPDALGFNIGDQIMIDDKIYNIRDMSEIELNQHSLSSFKTHELVVKDLTLEG